MQAVRCAGVPDDGGVEACVCDIDNFCCTVTWDSGCVEIVKVFGCADCSESNPDCSECDTNEDCPVAGNECIDGGCTCVEDPPINDNCGDVTPIDLPVFSGSSIEFTGTTSCGATNDCDALGADELWHAFTISSATDVVVSWCGSPVTHSPQWVTMADSCPCATTIGADEFNFVDCGAGDAENLEATYSSLPAGTYWAPVYSADDSDAIGENYILTVSIP